MATPQLNKAAVEQLLAQAPASSVWWLCIWYGYAPGDGPHGASPRKASLVLETGGQTQEHLLHNATCASLINRQAKGESFVTPHLAGFAYDDYELVAERQQAAAQLWNSGGPVVEQLLAGLYHLDDSAGIPLDLAQAWQAQAVRLLAELNWDRLLSLWRGAGPPYFEVNSRVLEAQVVRSAAALQAVRAFLQQHPLPTAPPHYAGPVTTGAGDGFPLRITLTYLSRPTGFEDGSRYAQYQLYNVAWLRQERDMEAALANSAARRSQQPANAPTDPDARRLSIRRRLLDIRSQIDELLSDMDQMDEFNRYRSDEGEDEY